MPFEVAVMVGSILFAAVCDEVMSSELHAVKPNASVSKNTAMFDLNFIR
jgi:hypothetical protein